MFKNLETDNIVVVKAKDGSKIENLKANVQSKGIYVFRNDILIEEGDVIERIMSNGGIEKYLVLDAGFYEKVAGIPSHYQMKVEKFGMQKKDTLQSVTYNISGNVGKINHQSVDNSINFKAGHDEIKQKIDDLLCEVQKLTNDLQKKDALELIEAIKEQCLSENPKKSILKSLVSALPPIDNITSIGSALFSMFES